jgi:predicted nucleotidyltransferase
MCYTVIAFARPVVFVTFLKLESYLSELIGRKVDLVTRKALKPNMGKTILQELVHV